jgi:tripartite-type tricarboxylate transporter receptor subunit TctC
MRALAVTGAGRSPLVPQVPTLAEAGLAGYEIPLRWGLAAPAGTSHAIVEMLNRAFNGALSSAEVRQRIALEGAQPEPTAPAEYAMLIDRELAMWSDLVKAAGIKPQ